MIQTKTITANARYLNLPVTNGAPQAVLSILEGEHIVREFVIELAESDPDFYVYTEIEAFKGKSLIIQAEGDLVPAGALDFVTQTKQFEGSAGLYAESYRPQFHFSSKRGWNNDPNGLVYYKGEYHLFYQHNPYGWKWGNMHWGHAVGTDLVHWTETGTALEPDAMGTMFSGSAVVDWNNSSGFQTGDEKPLVLIYTAAGGTSKASKDQPYTQCIAFSNDRGRSWTKYEGNPVISHIVKSNRDPKVIWHDATGMWILVLYLDKNDYAVFKSPNLKQWTQTQTLQVPGATECPDFFELPIDGNKKNTKWVFWGANGNYLLGSFDGQELGLENTEPLTFKHGGNGYAAQTWSDIPEQDGRRIQTTWMQVDLPGMPFNQYLTFPTELTLRSTPQGVRMFSEPIGEIADLRDTKFEQNNLTIKQGENPLSEVEGELLEIQTEYAIDDSAAVIVLSIRGTEITYHAATKTLTCLDKSAPLAPIDGRVVLQILVDRGSLEIFGNSGSITMTVGVVHDKNDRSLSLTSKNGSLVVPSVKVFTLKSIW